MRQINTHKSHDHDRQPILMALGNPGTGGGEQDYEIIYAGPDGTDHITGINFISLEKNGVTNEALLAIVIDRLEGFQAGQYACIENFDALTHCHAALAALHRRTRARIARGVENKAEV